MSMDSLRRLVETRIESVFKPAYLNTSIYYDNVPFTEVRTEAGFFRINFMESMGMQANLGTTSVDRFMGLLNLSMFVKEDTGTVKLNTELEAMAALFKKQTFTLVDGAYVTFRVPAYISMPVQRGYANRTSRIPYTRNETPD